MDAVIFRVKHAHLGCQRFARRLLRSLGLTPARFDLMHALGGRGMRQSDLWKRLDVTRSVVSEMVGALCELGWVKRVRAVDSRTWLVQLTRAGRALFDHAYREFVESAKVTLHVDAALCSGHVELDAGMRRLEIIHACDTLDVAFRALPWFRGPDLYFWNPEDYYFLLSDADERFGDLPFADDLSASASA